MACEPTVSSQYWSRRAHRIVTVWQPGNLAWSWTPLRALNIEWGAVKSWRAGVTDSISCGLEKNWATCRLWNGVPVLPKMSGRYMGLHRMIRWNSRCRDSAKWDTEPRIVRRTTKQRSWNYEEQRISPMEVLWNQPGLPLDSNAGVGAQMSHEEKRRRLWGRRQETWRERAIADMTGCATPPNRAVFVLVVFVYFGLWNSYVNAMRVWLFW